MHREASLNVAVHRIPIHDGSILGESPHTRPTLHSAVRARSGARFTSVKQTANSYELVAEAFLSN
jgi:hypothetical protein